MSDTLEELREKIAAIQHDQWSGWMKYLFSKCKYDNIEGLVIPVEYVKRWNRQMLTPYNELPENEKESDRIEADKLLALFSKELSIIEKKKDEEWRTRIQNYIYPNLDNKTNRAVNQTLEAILQEAGNGLTN